MNILITLEPKEILKKLDLEVIKEFLKEEQIEETSNKSSKELWDQFEEQILNEDHNIGDFIVERVSSKTLLESIHNDDIEEYVSEHTDLYISSDVAGLMEVINTHGHMDEVLDLFTLKYNGI